MAHDEAGAYGGDVFLVLLVIGLVGLAAMAIPAFGHSHAQAGMGHAAHGSLGRGAAHGTPYASATPVVSNARGALQHLLPADAAHAGVWRFVPSPRAMFSVLALYGAFGNAAVHAFHFPFLSAAISALFPALLVERVLVRPLWNVVFRLEASACSPLEQLILTEAQAVTPFRNGRGIVSTVRDGRRVQLVATLRQDQVTLPIRVGTRLLIEDVDAANERVTVTITRD
ncbi:MAG: hypothetical protein ABI488_10690 [Polyangiaceae bacterium]